MIFRIGITVGDVVERDGDLLGDGVNIAARLQGLAEPGGICVSRSVYEQVANKLSVRFADIGLQQVKNIPEPIHAYVTSTSSPQVQPQKQRTTKSAIMFATATLVGLATFVGASGIYLTFMRAHQTEPATTNPSPAETSTAPSAVTSKNDLAASQPSSQISPSTAPALARFNENKLRALAAEQSIPLPQTIRIVEASSAVPKDAAQYLGAWGGKERWNGHGRQMILLVTNIDEAGNATGIYAFGPPTSYTNQSPARYWGFAGTLAENNLRFESADGRWKYQFKIVPGGIMQGRLETPIHTHPEIIVERIN